METWVFGNDGREPNEEHLNLIQRKALKGLLVASGADRRLRNTLRTMTGDAFSRQELDVLEDRMLRNVSRGQIGVLQGITEGSPVVISPNQKAAIDELIDEVGADDLGRRVREAYRGALERGQLVVH